MALGSIGYEPTPWASRRRQTIVIPSVQPQYNYPADPPSAGSPYTGQDYTLYMNPPSRYSVWGRDLYSGSANGLRPPSIPEPSYTWYLPAQVSGGSAGGSNLEIPNTEPQDYRTQFRHSYDISSSQPWIGFQYGDVRIRRPSGDSEKTVEFRGLEEWIAHSEEDRNTPDQYSVSVRFPFTAFVRRFYLNKNHNPQTGVKIKIKIAVLMTYQTYSGQDYKLPGPPPIYDNYSGNILLYAGAYQGAQYASTFGPFEYQTETVEYEFKDSDNPAIDDYYEQIVWTKWISCGIVNRTGRFSYMAVNIYDGSILAKGYAYANNFIVGSPNLSYSSPYRDVWTESTTIPEFWSV